MLFSRSLDEWMKCQRNWLYLEPVFTTADIQRQLPQDSQLFVQVSMVLEVVPVHKIQEN